MARVRCCFCREQATSFFVTLNNCLWSTCEEHASPFRGTAIELDQEEYDLEESFSEGPDDDDEEDDDGKSLDPV